MNAAERIIRRVDAWQQRHKPAAFIFGVIKKYGDDNAGQLAASFSHTDSLPGESASAPESGPPPRPRPPPQPRAPQSPDEVSPPAAS